MGHMIDGRVLYPATGYLVLAWRALAKLEGQVFDQMPVCFENVHIHRATILPKTGKQTFQICIVVTALLTYFQEFLRILGVVQTAVRKP